MPRRRLHIALIAALAAGPACAGPPGAPLAAGQAPRSPAVGLGPAVTARAGVLTYAIAFAGERAVAAVELDTAFELVVRDIVSEPGSTRFGLRETRRIPLGSAEFDIEDLAVDTRRGRAYVASRDGRVRGFDLATGEEVVTWHLGSSATAVAVSPDGAYVVTGTADGVLCLRRHRDGALLQCAAAHQGQISGLDVSPDGARLASSSWTGEVVLWSVPSLSVVQRRRFPGAACDVAFAPDGRALAVARSARAPVRSPEILRRERDRGVHRPHPDHAITVWAWGRDRVAHMRGHGGPVTSVAWTPDSARVVSGSWDREVRMWSVPSGPAVARYGGFSLLVRDVAVSGDGRWVAAAAWTRGIDGPAMVVVNLRY